jgi:hypothetical protein
LTALAGLDAQSSSAAFDIMSMARFDADVRLILEPRRAANGSPPAAPSRN